MTAEFRVLTWNCKRAVVKSGVWDYLLELSPDVALLQEVGAIPAKVLAEFECHQQPATGKTGRPQKFNTAVMVRGRIGEPVSLKGLSGWVDAELERFEGNLICRELFPRNGPPVRAVSVYSPAWPIDPKRLAGIDVTGVRLTSNRDLWLADILWASLRHHKLRPTDCWIVAGDFNLSETFDQASWSAGGNREYLDRMAALGLTECLRKAKGGLTATFRNPVGGVIKHQIDHVFTTEALASRLVSCGTGLHERVFGAHLSDHLPVVAVFRA